MIELDGVERWVGLARLRYDRGSFRGGTLGGDYKRRRRRGRQG